MNTQEIKKKAREMFELFKSKYYEWVVNTCMEEEPEFDLDQIVDLAIAEKDKHVVQIQTTKDGTLTSIYSPQGFTMKLSKEDGCIIKPISRSKK